MGLEASERAAIVGAVAAALARWPGLAIDDRLATAAVETRLRRGTAPFSRLKLVDLCLADACERGDSVALRAFEAEIVPGMDAPLRRLGLDEAGIDEAKQRARERIFVGGPRTRPRIEAYTGIGPLRGWARAVAVREGQNSERPRRRFATLPTREGQAPQTLPDVAALRGLYREAVREAFIGALQALPAEDRVLLRAYHLEGRTLQALADEHGAHAATIHRRLRRCRRAVFEATRSALAARLAAHPDRAASVISLVRDQLYVSLAAALR